MDVTEAGNIQQRIYDAFPPFPEFVTILSLFKRFPYLESESIEKALFRLIQLGIVEKDKRTRQHLYRLRKNAKRPIDMRGRHGKSGRPHAH